MTTDLSRSVIARARLCLPAARECCASGHWGGREKEHAVTHTRAPPVSHAVTRDTQHAVAPCSDLPFDCHLRSYPHMQGRVLREF